MFGLTPKEDKFYDMFIDNAKMIYESAIMLKDFVYNLDGAEEKHKNIKEMEHKCDQVVHTTLAELNKTFLTPFDREDVYTIAKEMDNIEDFIESTASRFVLFNVAKTTEEAKELSEMIVQSTKELIVIMEELRLMNKSKLLTEKVIEVNRIEEEADVLSRKAIRSLFINDLPTLEVMKWREIYEHFENTLDSCENVANIVEGVAMKNA